MESDRWLGIEIRHLAALEAVSREGSFHRAAERLGYTQSAVSGQIALLERLVGERLLERPGGRRPVFLTEAGQLLLRHAERIVAHLAAARADLAAVSSGAAGVLRVGTYQSVGARLLPSVMREFASAWPQVEVRLEESADDGELMRMVEFGVVDLTFMSFPVADGPFATTELLRDPYVLVVPRDSPFVGRPEPPTLREIAKLPLIGYRGSEGHDALQTRLLARGIQAQIVFRSDDNGTVHGLVAEGFGAALIPRLSVDRHRDDVRALELGSRFTPRLIGMAWHRDRYQLPAARAFIETAQAMGARLAEETPDGSSTVNPSDPS
jgi:DNA-binding transcriptional LysR family regulator